MKTPSPIWRRRDADPEVARALEQNAFADRVVFGVCALIFAAVLAADLIDSIVGGLPL